MFNTELFSDSLSVPTLGSCYMVFETYTTTPNVWSCHLLDLTIFGSFAEGRAHHISSHITNDRSRNKRTGLPPAPPLKLTQEWISLKGMETGPEVHEVFWLKLSTLKENDDSFVELFEQSLSNEPTD